MTAAQAAPRIYLAGASKELDLCEHWRDELRRVGFEITHDWMAICREPKYAGVPPEKIPRDERRHLAAYDLEGVARAEAFWLVVPPEGSLSIGMWVELGYALRSQQVGGNLCIAISGPWRSIFQDVVPEDCVFEEHLRAFAHLCDHFGPALVESARRSAARRP